MTHKSFSFVKTKVIQMYKYIVYFHIIGFSTKILTENYVTESPMTPEELDKFEQITTNNRAKGLNDKYIRVHAVAFSKVK
jgi:hypothetical protein